MQDGAALSAELDNIEYIDMKKGIDAVDALIRLRDLVRLQVANNPLWQPATAHLVMSKNQEPLPNASEVESPIQHVQSSGKEKSALRDIFIGLFVTIVGGSSLSAPATVSASPGF